MEKSPFKYDSVGHYWKPVNRETFTLNFNKVSGAPKTLSKKATLNSYTIDLTTGHGFIADDLIFISQDGHIYQGQILSVDIDELTLDTPLNYAYSPLPNEELDNEPTVVFKIVDDLSVDGSGDPESFTVFAPGNHVWAITRIFVTMVLDGQPDDGLFGNITALTRGVVIRLKNSKIFNKGNFKTNGQIAGVCYDVTYTERTVPAGSYGLRARYTFSGSEKSGNPIILDGSLNELLEVLIQDDLTDLTEFKITAQGVVLK